MWFIFQKPYTKFPFGGFEMIFPWREHHDVQDNRVQKHSAYGNPHTWKFSRCKRIGYVYRLRNMNLHAFIPQTSISRTWTLSYVPLRLFALFIQLSLHIATSARAKHRGGTIEMCFCRMGGEKAPRMLAWHWTEPLTPFIYHGRINIARACTRDNPGFNQIEWSASYSYSEYQWLKTSNSTDFLLAHSTV